MEAALPEDHGVPDGDVANQQMGTILVPVIAMASKFSDHGKDVTGLHKVVKEIGPPQALLSEELHTDRTHTLYVVMAFKPVIL